MELRKQQILNELCDVTELREARLSLSTRTLAKY